MDRPQLESEYRRLHDVLDEVSAAESAAYAAIIIAKSGEDKQLGV